MDRRGFTSGFIISNSSCTIMVGWRAKGTVRRMALQRFEDKNRGVAQQSSATFTGKTIAPLKMGN